MHWRTLQKILGHSGISAGPAATEAEVGAYWDLIEQILREDEGRTVQECGPGTAQGGEMELTPLRGSSSEAIHRDARGIRLLPRLDRLKIRA